jgi:ribonuclease P protein component
MGEPCWRAAVPKAAINSRLATREPSGTPSRLGFPKSARILKASEFRKAYQEGIRIRGQYFAAFCLKVPRAADAGPRLGFTVPRAFGKAVMRNKVKRRLRETIRLRLQDFAPEWDIVINPRRAALDASPQDLRREVDRLITQCGKQ